MLRGVEFCHQGSFICITEHTAVCMSRGEGVATEPDSGKIPESAHSIRCIQIKEGSTFLRGLPRNEGSWLRRGKRIAERCEL